MEYGERNFRIITSNMGNLRNYETMKDWEIRMRIRKIDIACIQEKHNTTNDIVGLGKYNIYLSRATGNIDNMNGMGALQYR